MVKNNFLAKLSGFWIFYRWHPEVALRYLPIVDEIKKVGNEKRILEVGSGGLGIIPYLGKPVTGVDIEFKPPFHSLLTKIKGSASKLPFKNASFDIVISVDMLEHLKEENREKAVKEMIRVAKKKIFMAVPCGKEAYMQDLLLDKYHKHKFGKRYHFLEEQLHFGLPEKKDVYNTILREANSLGKGVKVKIKDNENLTLRNFLMKGWLTNNIIVDIFFRKILLFALPLLRLFNQKPCYRQIFYIDIV